MKKNESEKAVSRRGFLISGGKSAIAAGGIAVASGLIATDSLAAEGVQAAKKSHFDATLLRIARDIYPHDKDKLADKYYEQPLALVKKSDAALLEQGVKDLDKLAMERIGAKFVAIPSEADRVRLLRSIEESDFFAKLKGTLLVGIYNNKEVWPIFGYEGSSWEKGGYLHRGFNDIDWL